MFCACDLFYVFIGTNQQFTESFERILGKGKSPSHWVGFSGGRSRNEKLTRCIFRFIPTRCACRIRGTHCMGSSYFIIFSPSWHTTATGTWTVAPQREPCHAGTRRHEEPRKQSASLSSQFRMFLWQKERCTTLQFVLSLSEGVKESVIITQSSN